MTRIRIQLFEPHEHQPGNMLALDTTITVGTDPIQVSGLRVRELSAFQVEVIPEPERPRNDQHDSGGVYGGHVAQHRNAEGGCLCYCPECVRIVNGTPKCCCPDCTEECSAYKFEGAKGRRELL